jgi:hypothetical protein
MLVIGEYALVFDKMAVREMLKWKERGVWGMGANKNAVQIEGFGGPRID